MDREWNSFDFPRCASGTASQDAAVDASDADYLARFEQMGRFFMGVSDVHAALARITHRLDDLGVSYAVCGGLAVNAHGHLRATTDIDLLVTADGLDRFKQAAVGLGWLEKFPGSRGLKDADRKIPIDFLVAGGIPGDGTPHGVVFPDPAAVAIERAGVRFVKLESLIEMKLASGITLPQRLQDLADVVALIRVNRLPKEFGDALHPFVRAKWAELWADAQAVDPLAE